MTLEQYASTIKSLIDRAQKAEAELKELKSGQIIDGMKGECIGEVFFNREVFDENGDEATEKIYVPWTECKEIYSIMLKSKIRLMEQRS